MTVQLSAEEIKLSKTLSILQQKHSHFATLVFFCTIMKMQLQGSSCCAHIRHFPYLESPGWSWWGTHCSSGLLCTFGSDASKVAESRREPEPRLIFLVLILLVFGLAGSSLNVRRHSSRTASGWRQSVLTRQRGFPGRWKAEWESASGPNAPAFAALGVG